MIVFISSIFAPTSNDMTLYFQIYSFKFLHTNVTTYFCNLYALLIVRIE